MLQQDFTDTLNNTPIFSGTIQTKAPLILPPIQRRNSNLEKGPIQILDIEESEDWEDSSLVTEEVQQQRIIQQQSEIPQRKRSGDAPQQLQESVTSQQQQQKAHDFYNESESLEESELEDQSFEQDASGTEIQQEHYQQD
ncbi:hypothetical protein FGO68_gene2005 [Halteria grandinella]|uniref:Uncharacterized protein n=1 Tax=Halteria grandinella TaxID=5974 RepID=A0A8J8NPL1_HALGN|nr:hypothetical protein FGO68_gene2005 [Halteria grandinella]